MRHKLPEEFNEEKVVADGRTWNRSETAEQYLWYWSFLRSWPSRWQVRPGWTCPCSWIVPLVLHSHWKIAQVQFVLTMGPVPAASSYCRTRRIDMWWSHASRPSLDIFNQSNCRSSRWWLKGCSKWTKLEWDASLRQIWCLGIALQSVFSCQYVVVVAHAAHPI